METFTTLGDILSTPAEGFISMKNMWDEVDKMPKQGKTPEQQRRYEHLCSMAQSITGDVNFRF